MNGTSSDSSAAGSRPERLRAALAAALALTLGACGSRPEPTAQDIAPTPGDFPRIASIEAQVVAGESDLAPASGMVSGARLIYHLGAPDGGVYKVRVMLFRDEGAAKQHWQGMHRAEALAATAPLDAGDEGWIYQGEMAATRAGRSIFEVKARGATGRLADFVRACARKAEGRLNP